MVAFDLLYLNGNDLRHKTAQFSESFEVDGPEVYKHACRSASRVWSQRSATAAIRPAAQ